MSYEELILPVKYKSGSPLTETDVTPDTPLPVEVGDEGDSAPALATNASGVLGWLRKLVDVLSGTLTVNALTDAELRAADVDVADSGERIYTHATATVTAAGDTTIVTPTSGARLRPVWFYAINDPAATAHPIITIKIGSTELFRAWAISKRQRYEGAVDETISINLDIAGRVAVTIVYEEF